MGGWARITLAVAREIELPGFSLPAFLSLLLCMLAGTATFYQLVRRWTRHRPRAALEEWAGARRFAVHWPPKAAAPAALQRLVSERAAVANATLERGPLTLVRLSLPGSRRWHVLVQQTDRNWTPMGLRATGIRKEAAAESLVEAFGLPAFAALLLSDRFVVHAAESRAARAMARAPARGLLPPDVGLLLSGANVMLDFSDRPFDAVEFDRMLAVMEQLVDHLPAD
jgi:hypothetical protein